jgi:hypothetical protein
MQHKYREGLPSLPPYMESLPIDKRGFPVPWFTPWDKEKEEWNFQAVAPGKATEAMQKHICWVCGKKMFRNLAYVLGPMCAINRVSSEPACHVECAEFSARACPFLTKPQMRRPTLNKPEYHRADGTPVAPGIGIERNPGVCLVWVTRSFKPFRTRENDILITVGDPIRVKAWREGREATSAEVIESIRTGLPELLKYVYSNADMREFIQRVGRAWKDLSLPDGVDLGNFDAHFPNEEARA